MNKLNLCWWIFFDMLKCKNCTFGLQREITKRLGKSACFLSFFIIILASGFVRQFS